MCVRARACMRVCERSPRPVCLLRAAAHLVMDFMLGHTYDRGHVLKEKTLETLETLKIEFYTQFPNAAQVRGLHAATQRLVI